MLTLCPECQLQVSDKALSCPHCGYPFKPEKISKPRINKRKRLPNGFGQITKISNKNLRNPYRVMVPVGKTDTGRPISKLLKPKAYFKTYNDAYAALVEYNKNPYSPLIDPTVEEVYNHWKAEFLKKPKASTTIKNYDSPWTYCGSVYSLPIRQLKVQHIKDCINPEDETNTPPVTIKPMIKTLFNVLLDYALENEYVDKNCSRMFKLSEEISLEAKKNRKTHSSFTDEEMDLLWKYKDDEDVQSILIQCYTGLRPQELCLIRLDNIDLDKNVMVGGMKTEAGTMRTIPIHPAIKPFVESKYQTAKNYNLDRLITVFRRQNKNNRVVVEYTTYNYRFETAITRCGLSPNHRPHDPRKQFVTMAKKYKLDEYAIKRIVGHKIDDITEAIYTDRSDQWLYDEICKISVPQMK